MLPRQATRRPGDCRHASLRPSHEDLHVSKLWSHSRSARRQHDEGGGDQDWSAFQAKDHAMRLSFERKLKYVNGYDAPDILAGQGTIGLEILEQVRKWLDKRSLCVKRGR